MGSKCQMVFNKLEKVSQAGSSGDIISFHTGESSDLDYGV